MNTSTLRYSPPRSLSRVLWPVIVWTLVAIGVLLLAQVLPGPDDMTGELTSGEVLVVWTGLCGLWLIGALLPPRLEADGDGLCWTRLGLLRRRIAWRDVTHVITSARPCERDGCPCLTNYLTVSSKNDDLDLSAGFVVQEDDVRAMAAVIGEAVERYRPEVEIIDDLGWIRQA